MRKTALMFILAATASVMAVAPSKAQSVDIGEATCKEVLALGKDDLSAILMWTHGYFGGKAGDTKIDFKEFEAAGGVIGEYCAAHPDDKWLESIEKLGNG